MPRAARRPEGPRRGGRSGAGAGRRSTPAGRRRSCGRRRGRGRRRLRGRARCRRGTDALDRKADALKLGGEHVLGALLGAGHARLPNERVEEREGPLRAVVDRGVDGPLEVMVFRLGHFAESTMAESAVGAAKLKNRCQAPIFHSRWLASADLLRAVHADAAREHGCVPAAVDPVDRHDAPRLGGVHEPPGAEVEADVAEPEEDDVARGGGRAGARAGRRSTARSSSGRE